MADAMERLGEIMQEAICHELRDRGYPAVSFPLNYESPEEQQIMGPWSDLDPEVREYFLRVAERIGPRAEGETIVIDSLGLGD